MQTQQDILSRQRPRRVWDERLPDGRSVAELLRESLTSPVVTAQQPTDDEQVRYLTPEQPPTQTYGQPRTGSMEVRTGQLEGVAPPPLPGSVREGITPSTGYESRPAIVGGSREADPLKRDAARIRTMLQYPSRQVIPEGSAGTSHPMSRWKAGGLGALLGLAQGGPDTSVAARLAAGATGAGLGVAKPSLIQGWRRRMEVEEAQDQLTKQQKLGLGQAQLESEQAETRQRQMAPALALIESERKARYDQERLRVQQQAAEGRISIAEATRKLRELELDERKRHNLETENISRTRPVSDAQAAQAAEGETIAASTREAASALKSELDKQKGQLIENERAITRKEAWWNSEARKRLARSREDRSTKEESDPEFDPKKKFADILEEVKAEDPDYQSGGHDTLLNNTKALRDAVSAKETRLANMADEIRKGSAKAARSSRPARATATVSEQAIRDAAVRRGLDPEKAVERARRRRLL